MRVARRALLRTLALAAPGSAACLLAQSASGPGSLGIPVYQREFHGESSVLAALRAGQLADSLRPARTAGLPHVDLTAVGATLRRRFHDLRRHFIFEYYPWYRTDPWFHWDEGGRRPPVDIATNYMPLLGAYDSRDRRVIERHARWIAETGAGAINLSWWGPGSYEDGNVSLVMDVMRDHDIHVAFHLEPYRNEHAALYAQDILYLIRTYGDRRHWDCFLILENADGSQGPVFKSFRTILPAFITDCHGVRFYTPDYAPDDTWQVQTQQVRKMLEFDFDHVTLLADSLDVGRTRVGGFDGIAIYDNFVLPATWPEAAQNCRDRSLLFSFNINPGYDAVVPRPTEPPAPPDPNACPRPPSQVPEDEIDWTTAGDRRRAARQSAARIHDSFQTTVALQTDTTLPNAQRGFLVVYINSFNEWFEGHQFEPMKDYATLTPTERERDYHNAVDGDHRRKTLTGLLGTMLGT